jgi:hypothetical protein
LQLLRQITIGSSPMLPFDVSLAVARSWPKMRFELSQTIDSSRWEALDTGMKEFEKSIYDLPINPSKWWSRSLINAICLAEGQSSALNSSNSTGFRYNGDLLDYSWLDASDPACLPLARLVPHDLVGLSRAWARTGHGGLTTPSG